MPEALGAVLVIAVVMVVVGGLGVAAFLGYTYLQRKATSTPPPTDARGWYHVPYPIGERAPWKRLLRYGVEETVLKAIAGPYRGRHATIAVTRHKELIAANAHRRHWSTVFVIHLAGQYPYRRPPDNGETTPSWSLLGSDLLVLVPYQTADLDPDANTPTLDWLSAVADSIEPRRGTGGP